VAARFPGVSYGAIWRLTRVQANQASHAEGERSGDEEEDEAWDEEQ
jgi:hypothetical protein